MITGGLEGIAGYLKPILDVMLPGMDTLATAAISKAGTPGDASAWSVQMEGIIKTVMSVPKESITEIAGTEVSITRNELGICISVFDVDELDNGIFRMVL